MELIAWGMTKALHLDVECMVSHTSIWVSCYDIMHSLGPMTEHGFDFLYLEVFLACVGILLIAR